MLSSRSLSHHLFNCFGQPMHNTCRLTGSLSGFEQCKSILIPIHSDFYRFTLNPGICSKFERIGIFDKEDMDGSVKVNTVSPAQRSIANIKTLNLIIFLVWLLPKFQYKGFSNFKVSDKSPFTKTLAMGLKMISFHAEKLLPFQRLQHTV